MKVPLSVGLLTITHAIDTDTAIATATNTDTDTLTATVTAMATAPAPAPAAAPAPNTSYSCRTFLALSLLVLRLGAFTHYCVYIFFVVVPGQTPKYKPAHTLTTATTTTPDLIHNLLVPRLTSRKSDTFPAPNCVCPSEEYCVFFCCLSHELPGATFHSC